MKVKKLSTNEHWDNDYQEQLENKAYLKKRKFTSYSEMIFWKITESYLPKGNSKILEVGSAPGIKLIEFNKEMSYEPYGMDYSFHGCELNREVFKLNNCNPKNVFQVDFFSKEFQNKYKNYFDVVTSFGFIEHFDNVEEIIKNHCNLLKEGGYLIITIPNFKGINLALANFFSGKSLIEMHNTDIMEIETFKNLFDNAEIDQLYCNYYGIFNFDLIYYKRHNIFKTLLYSVFFWMNIGLNVLFKFLFKLNFSNNLENRKFSPFIIFIGKKNMK